MDVCTCISIHFTVHLKLTQHCKLIILQYILNENKQIKIKFLVHFAAPIGLYPLFCLLDHICLLPYPLIQRRQWHSTPVLLPGKSHGWRNLVGCSRGVSESWTRLSDFSFTFHFHALEKEMAIHSSILAWRIPGTVEPGGLPRVRHD